MHDQNIMHLCERYVAICNEALTTHANQFPYQHIIALSENMLTNTVFDLAVYDDTPKAALSLKFVNSRLIFQGSPDDVRTAWRVNLSYMQSVVTNPEQYINNPEMLDIDWLKSRVGL